MINTMELKTHMNPRPYTRREIFTLIKRQNPSFPYNSMTWILEKAEKDGVLFKTGLDSYSLKKDNRLDYIPNYSAAAKDVISFMENQFPELNFIVFETFLLNEFVNHMIAKNTIIVQIEKDLCQFTFDALNDKYTGKVLYNPSSEDLSRYWTENCIILENLVSEAPVKKEAPHEVCIEKLLVDCVSDRILTALTSSSELEYIYSDSISKYRVEATKLKRYSKRRNSWNKIEKLIKEVRND